MYNFNIIFDAETIIGYSWDIERYVKYAMEHEISPDDEDALSLAQEELDELAKHDGLVECWYHPMGAWVVTDLVRKGEE